MTDNMKSELADRVQELQDEAVAAYLAGQQTTEPVPATQRRSVLSERRSEPRKPREPGKVRDTPIVDTDAFLRAQCEANDIALYSGHPYAVWTVQGMRFRVDPVGMAPYQWTVWQTDTQGPPPCNKWRNHADK